MGYFAGIDLGTSSVKVLIIDENGKTLAVSHAGYDVQTPALSYAEQDPEIWWERAVEAIRAALTLSGIHADELQGIGLSGQMHGLVALDAQHKPVCPAIIWMDQRTAKEVEYIKQQAQDLMDSDLLNQPAAGLLIASLYWIKQHKPDVYARIAYVMLPKDYIRYRLTGVIGTDISDASASLAFSIKKRRWCTELLEKLGIDVALFPPVGGSYDRSGTVCAYAATETGLSQKTNVVYGMSDAAAQLIGNGIVSEGCISCNIGTGSQIAAVIKKPVYDTERRVQTWCHAIPSCWYIQGGSLTGGITLSWLKKKILCDGRSYAELDGSVDTIMPGSEGLIFLPYLAGERSPFINPYAKGVYFGLTVKHEQAHIIRATMEGVLYNLKECVKIFDTLGIEKTRLIASGGAAKSTIWKQMQADIFEMPVYTTNTEEEACLGAAILAAVDSGIYQDIPQACETIVHTNERPIEPNQNNFDLYRMQQDKFVSLYNTVKCVYTFDNKQK
ncbi:MAG: xylulokinase [Treponema sp.]|nr:xylulokinase [Treponema sp.]